MGGKKQARVMDSEDRNTENKAQTDKGLNSE